MKKFYYQQSFLFNKDEITPVITEDEIESSKMDTTIESFVDSLLSQNQVMVQQVFMSIGENVACVITYRDTTPEEERGIMAARAAKSGLELKM